MYSTTEPVSGKNKKLQRSKTTTGVGNKQVNRQLDRLIQDYLKNDRESIQKSFSDHAEYTLARTKYNLDTIAAYQSAAYSVRDRMIEKWNDTQQFITENDPKRVYYLSLEFLMGRSLQNALHNMEIQENFDKALFELGFVLEELFEEERDAALGNGGLGRLAACFVDSLASLNYPAWGYGIRYHYGMFEQGVKDGFQTETPDYWLTGGNPWEIPRLDIHYPVRFYGEVHQHTDENGDVVYSWDGGEIVEAVAYDIPIPGYKTANTNNIRLWSSMPSKEFDLSSFNRGNYYMAVEDKQRAENITSVLYPDDSTHEGKELRLKQQYFFCSATLSDILRRYLKLHDDWDDLPNKVAIQLNDTHPTIAILELMRLLIDEYHEKFDYAWQLTQKVFSYTNHTILPEALEKWPVGTFQHLFPRHLQIINQINHNFLLKVEQKWPGDVGKLRTLSIYEEGDVKKIRMANLAIVGTHCTNGVAALHTELLKTKVFPDFYALFPERFQNKTNGVTPRRWVAQSNPALSAILTKWLGSDDWIQDMDKVTELKKFASDPKLQTEWIEMRVQNKARLIETVFETVGVKLKAEMLFDVQIKRIHEYKRQLLNILGVIHQYMKLKAMTPEERKKVVPRAVIFAGKAAPAYHSAKRIIKLINSVSSVINADTQTRDYLMSVFLPNYNVSMAQVVIPASDLNQQISTAGMEASGTGNMKFMMNGSLIIGTMDGANVEIAEQVGPENMFIFGLRTEETDRARQRARERQVEIDNRLQKVFAKIRSGAFGDPNLYESLLHNLETSDYFLLVPDFPLYLDAMDRVYATYKNQSEWIKKSIMSTACSAYFSSDRTIREYAEQIWSIKPLKMLDQNTREREHHK